MKVKNKKPLLLILIFLFHLIYILIYGSIFGFYKGADAINYYNLAEGKEVYPPFNNRIFIPFIVSCFPIEIHETIFKIIIIVSMSSIPIIIYLLLEAYNYRLETRLFALIIYIGSSFFLSLSFDYGLIDAPFYLIIMVLLLYVKKGKYIITSLVLILAYFTKEAALFYVPIILINAIYDKNLRLILSIIIVSIVLGAVYLINNYGRPFDFNFFLTNLAYHNISLNHGIINALVQFIILIYGYCLYLMSIVIFFVFIGFLKSEFREKINLIFIFLVMLFSLFGAVDWSRMFFLIFPLIIIIWAKPFEEVLYFKAFNNKLILSVLIFTSGGWLIIYPIASKILYDFFYNSSLQIIVYALLSLPLLVIYFLYFKLNMHLKIITILSKDIVSIKKKFIENSVSNNSIS